MRRVVLLVLIASTAFLLLAVAHVAPAAAADPCDGVSDGHPRNDPEPLVSGSVWDVTSTKSAIQSASLELYKCVSGSSVSQGTTTTNSSGYYEFGVDADHNYYVDALNTGPLAGMTAANGTPDPSAVVWVGPDATIDFEFED